MREEWSEDILLEVARRVAVEVERAERAAIFDFLSMMPGTHDEKDLVVVHVLRFDRLVDGNRSINVFLVPETEHEHDRHFEWLRGEDLVHRLLRPPRVIVRMLEDLLPEADLLEPVQTPQVAR